MKYPRAAISQVMSDYFGDDDRRIEHALRVLIQAERLMIEDERCDAEIVIACALLHDVGIKVSEREHGGNTGNHHSSSRYDYPELEILKKADRIVNRSKDIQ